MIFVAFSSNVSPMPMLKVPEILDSLVAAEFQGDPKVSQGQPRLVQGLLEAVAQPGADFPQDEGMAEELLHRHLFPPEEGVARRDDQHHAVAGEVAELQMGVVGLATHDPEADLAAFPLTH